MSPNPSGYLTRRQIIFGALMGVAVWALAQRPGFPFPPGFAVTAICSCLLHSLILIIFHRIVRAGWYLANIANMILLGFALHYSGGILSPFLAMLPIIFISGSGYRFRTDIGFGAAITVFLSVLLLEAAGIVAPIEVSPGAVYAHWPAVVLVAASLMGYMWSAASIYDVTVQSLWRKMDQETTDKLAMLQKVVDLERDAQVAAIAERVTHDIRGPLGAVREFMKDLAQKERALSPEGKDDCVLFAEQVDRLLALNEEIRLQARRPEDPMEMVPVLETLQRVLSIIRYYPGGQRVRFELDGGAPPRLRVRANANRFHQICFNILKNGIEALEGRRGPRIDIRIEEDAGAAVIAFSDNGRGIPGDTLKQLGLVSVTTKKAGRGLGILIVQDLLRACGGSLKIDSREGEGTCARLTFQQA